jgi:hypothetical protein
VILPWAQLVPALETMFKRLSNLPVTSAPNAAQGVLSVTSAQGGLMLPSDTQLADIEFSVVSDVGVGDVELRMRYDEDVPYPGDTYEPDPEDPEARLGSIIAEINENRQVTLQVTVSSARQDLNAYDYARVMRDRLPLPSALDELRAMGLALADVGPVQGPIPTLDPNHRAVSKYAFEMVCNYMSYAIDAPQTTIETADIATTVDT